MAEYVAGPEWTAQATAALPRYSVVQMASTGKIAACVAATKPVGVVMEAVLAADDYVAVRSLVAGSTIKCIAVKAIDIGDPVYTAAGGKVSDAATTAGGYIGIAKTASAADNEIIEVICTGVSVNP